MNEDERKAAYRKIRKRQVMLNTGSGQRYGSLWYSADGGTPPQGGGVEPLPLPPSVASIVAIGDSFTVGTGASDAAHRWINIVAASLGATLTNNAIAGTVLQNSLNASSVPFANNGRDRYFAAMIGGGNKKAMGIIPYGFNDARYTAAPTTFNVAEYAVDYEEIVIDLLQQGYGPADIVVVSPWYITDTGLITGTAGFSDQTRIGFEAFVTAAAAVAAKYGVYYYDAYAYMRDNGGASLIGGDNIHPTDTGHAVIATGFMLAKRTPVAVLPLPVPFLLDTFTAVDGTLLTAHTSDSGASWSLQTGYAPASGNVITAGSMWAPSSTGVYKTSAIPPTADYGVRAIMIFLTTINDNIGVIGRADPAANTFYFFRLDKASGVYQLFKTLGGVSTQLGSDVADGGTFAGLKSIELRMVGTTISGWVNNVKVIEVTDSSITLAGRAGVRMAGSVQTATTGIHIDKITALNA